VQSYIDARQFSATQDLRRYAFDFRHYNGGTGVDLESPGQTIGGATKLTLQDGTNAVYKISFTGAADVKRAPFNLWAGEKVLMEKSSPVTGNVLTDTDVWRFCFAYQPGECRTSSNAGDLYAVLPRMDNQPNCWASQMNLRVPCAMAGPVQAMHATQVRIDQADPGALGQRTLSSLLMGPSQQYVYSKVLPTPDGSYLLFAGFLTGGYHTALMMAKLPKFPNYMTVRSTYVPVPTSGTGSSVYAEFGYEEYGGPTKFFCTARQEACSVAAPVINESAPFSFASETVAPAVGGAVIAIPALAGHLLYYRVVSDGAPGPLQVIAVP